MLVRTVKHLANGRRFWAGRPRHTLCGLHHNYVTRTRAGKTLPYQPLLRKHAHRRKSQWSLNSRMAHSSAVRFSPIASDVVELAEKLALASNSIFIGTEHLLQALLTLPNRYPLWQLYYDFGKGKNRKILGHFPLNGSSPKRKSVLFGLFLSIFAVKSFLQHQKHTFWEAPFLWKSPK